MIFILLVDAEDKGELADEEVSLQVLPKVGFYLFCPGVNAYAIKKF